MLTAKVYTVFWGHNKNALKLDIDTLLNSGNILKTFQMYALKWVKFMVCFLKKKVKTILSSQTVQKQEVACSL